MASMDGQSRQLPRTRRTAAVGIDQWAMTRSGREMDGYTRFQRIGDHDGDATLQRGDGGHNGPVCSAVTFAVATSFPLSVTVAVTMRVGAALWDTLRPPCT